MEELTECDPNGRLILVIGKQKKEFRINHRLLCQASPVFKVLLSYDLVEGQGICGPGQLEPTRIALPDDCSWDLEVILRLIHDQVEYVEEGNITACEILGIVNIADKYDCVKVLGPAGDRWLQWIINHCDDLHTYVIGMIAATILGNRAIFRQSTAGFLKHHTESLLNIKKEIKNTLVFEVLNCVEEKRAYLRGETLKALLSASDIGDVSACLFNCKELYVFNVTRQVRNIKLVRGDDPRDWKWLKKSSNIQRP